MQSRTLRGVLAAALGLFAAAAAQAEIVVFEFRGTLTYSAYMAPVGSPIHGYFAWDTDAPRRPRHRPSQPPSNDSNLTFYNAPDTLGILAKVGAHTIFSRNLGVAVYDNWGGNVGDMIDINGNEPVVDGTTYANGYLSIRLASQPEDLTALVGADLPRQLPLRRFDNAVNYAELRSDGSQTGGIFSFTMDSLERVPTLRGLKLLRP